MNIETLQLRIAEHASIGTASASRRISRADLERSFREQFVRGYRFKMSRKTNVLTLHAYYGQTHIEIPEAVRWTKRHNDRVWLGCRYGD